ncbi:MAG TPA: hypothetical protein VMZ92_20195 [Planctomycetota bacterium]|nr:hypothetical protein [Planctomycetota bacterium]
MRRLTLVFLAVFLLLAGSPVLLAQGTFPLKYEDAGDDSAAVMMAGQGSAASKEKPPGLTQVPAGLQGDVVYFAMEVGTRRYHFVLDSSTPVKLYADTDADGDLSDEKPLTVVTPESKDLPAGFPGTSHAVATLTNPATKKTLKIRIIVLGRQIMIVRQAGYVAGDVRLGGKSCRLAVVDGDFDGLYDRRMPWPASPHERGTYDSLAVDLDGNGKFELDAEGTIEVCPLPRMIHVGDAYYSLEVAPDGSSVNLATATPEFGTLDVGTGDVKITTWSDSGVHQLSGSEGKWRLPAGGYMALMLNQTKTDKNGAKWSLSCAGNTGKLQSFQIRAGEALSIKVGPPVSVAAETAVRGGVAYISLSMTGQGGEQYRTALKDGQQMPAPRLTIVTPKGRVLASGSFEYG